MKRLVFQSASGYHEIKCEKAGTGSDIMDLLLTPGNDGRVKINGNANWAEQFIISGVRRVVL